ncbi:MAG: hypothetical protein AAF596_00320 [Planctomycetota bacterium]
MELEARRVLSADFTLGAQGLVLHGFDADSDGLTITQVEDDYVFTLRGGEWDGAAANGVNVDGSSLSVSTSVLEPLASGIRVLATPGLSLDVTFGHADFSGLAGPVEIVGASSLSQDSGSLITTPAAALAVVAPDGLVLGDMNLSGNFNIEFNGTITDAAGTSIVVDGDASFVSRPGGLGLSDLNRDGLINGDDIDLWGSSFGTASPATESDGDTNDDTFVNAADFAILRDSLGTTPTGGIQLADNAGDTLIVSGKATFVAQSADGTTRFPIKVGTGLGEPDGGAVEFGSVSVFGGAVVIVEDNGETTPDGTVLDDSDATSLEILSDGAITDTGTTTVAVAALAKFSAGAGAADITLDDTYNFGSLQFTGNNVAVVEQSAMVIVGDSAANAALDLQAAGSITDSGSNSLTVVGNASFDSTTDGPITLDGLTYAFGSLTVDGGAVTVIESDATELSGTSSAASLDVTSGGNITDAAGAVVGVTGKAVFDASPDDNLTTDDEGDITLDAAALNFGSLEFKGDQVTISEASATVLSGTSLANELALTSADQITDDGTADLTVSGNASFESTADAAITLDDTYRFGSLTFDGGVVFVKEADATSLAALSEAASLTIQSAGAITDDAGATLTVTGNASFQATNTDPITLDGTVSLGSLTFSGGVVAMSEADATVLTGVSTATSLALTSAGSITDSGTADLTITGNASFAAVGNPITLDDTYNFGSLTFQGAAVTVVEQSATILSGDSDATTLDLNANGPIADAAGSDVNVTGNAKLTSATGGVITLDETVNLGSLTVMGGAVTIAEDSGTVLSGTSTADSLTLDSAGSITDDTTADVTVTGAASFNALNDDAITLDDTYNFGTLRFDGGVVTIVEASGTELAGASVADSLSLTSLGSITDAADATLFVTSGAGAGSFTANGSILLADAGAANQIAIIDASFTAGVVGPEDSIAVGVVPATGNPADALLLLNVLSFNTPGSVQLAVDGNIALPPTLPASAPAMAPAMAPLIDDAFAAIGEDELAFPLDLLAA